MRLILLFIFLSTNVFADTFYLSKDFNLSFEPKRALLLVRNTHRPTEVQSVLLSVQKTELSKRFRFFSEYQLASDARDYEYAFLFKGFEGESEFLEYRSLEPAEYYRGSLSESALDSELDRERRELVGLGRRLEELVPQLKLLRQEFARRLGKQDSLRSLRKLEELQNRVLQSERALKSQQNIVERMGSFESPELMRLSSFLRAELSRVREVAKEAEVEELTRLQRSQAQRKQLLEKVGRLASYDIERLEAKLERLRVERQRLEISYPLSPQSNS